MVKNGCFRVPTFFSNEKSRKKIARNIRSFEEHNSKVRSWFGFWLWWVKNKGMYTSVEPVRRRICCESNKRSFCRTSKTEEEWQVSSGIGLEKLQRIRNAKRRERTKRNRTRAKNERKEKERKGPNSGKRAQHQYRFDCGRQRQRQRQRQYYH